MPFIIRPYRRFLPLVYRSGVWSLITLLLLIAGPAYGGWVSVGIDGEGMNAYVDIDTIHRNGNLVQMWTLVDIKAGKGHAFLSHKEHVEYDCAAERHRLLAGSWYSEHMGKGNVDALDSYENKWSSIKPESIPEMLWKFACGKQ
jgi:surface-adhesin protein E